MLFSIEDFLIYGVLTVNLLIVFWVWSISQKTRDIKVLKDRDSLIKQFEKIDKNFKSCKNFEAKAEKNFSELEEKIQENLKNIEIVRFNPFKHEGMGGDQSFAFTLLNKKGDGVVISSLYSREKVSVFAKPIQNWQSKYELSGEEKIVLERARK